MDDKEFLVTAQYNGEAIALREVDVTMSYDGQDAHVDAETAIKRCIMLAHENQFLKAALEKALGDTADTPQIEIAQMSDIPEASDDR